MRFLRVLVAGLALTAGAPGPAISTGAGGGRQAGVPQVRSPRDDETTARFRRMGRNTIWRRVRTVALGWQTFHTQGLVKIGGTFYVSAVEVLQGTVRNGTATDALYDFSIDRSAGAGRGWLFKFDDTGRLLGRVELTDGAKYHPSGLDYDGSRIWVAVAEYRPNSRSTILRVDPGTLAVETVFSESDHIGGLVRNVRRGTLHGVSWGSRRLYTWTLAGTGGGTKLESSDWIPNPQSYVDYQDCHYQGVEYMLCGGVAGYATPLGHIAFGGLDLVDLRDARLAHQVPVNVFVDEGGGPNPGLALTHNAFWVEPHERASLRVYFMTESDNQADLLVYEATPWVDR